MCRVWRDENNGDPSSLHSAEDIGERRLVLLHMFQHIQTNYRIRTLPEARHLSRQQKIERQHLDIGTVFQSGSQFKKILLVSVSRHVMVVSRSEQDCEVADTRT